MHQCHTAYDYCERCVQKGKWYGKVVMSDLNAPLRTDSSFHSQENKAHHSGTSPFTELQCRMITSFPLDYMHLFVWELYANIYVFGCMGLNHLNYPKLFYAVFERRYCSSIFHESFLGNQGLYQNSSYEKQHNFDCFYCI